MSMPDPRRWPVGKVGYIAVVGRPNVGKSTLLNQVLGEHLLAVSPLPQTTRRHWRGILSTPTSQLVFVDTPGAHVGKTKLNQAMLKSVYQALDDADVILCLADPTRPCGDEDALVAERVAAAGKPTILVVNKTDVAEAPAIEEAKAFFLEKLGEATPVATVAALTGEGVEALVTELRDQLPTGPFFYPPDQAMDAVEREIGAEIIREAALEVLREEVPHALAVEVMEWKEGEKKLRIQATLFVERSTQKMIVVGKGGAMIAEIRRRAVKLLREWQQTHIALSLFVKVAADWRNRSKFLKEHGLIEEE